MNLKDTFDTKIDVKGIKILNEDNRLFSLIDCTDDEIRYRPLLEVLIAAERMERRSLELGKAHRDLLDEIDRQTEGVKKDTDDVFDLMFKVHEFVHIGGDIDKQKEVTVTLQDTYMWEEGNNYQYAEFSTMAEAIYALRKAKLKDT